MTDIPRIRLFSVGDRVYVRAQQIWLVLTAYMRRWERPQPKVLTYGQVATMIGLDPRAGITLARPLGIVGNYCKLNGLPTMNAIVVNEQTGIPGDHVVKRPGKSVKQEQQESLMTDWFSYRVPTTGTFRQVWEAMQRGTI